MWEFRHAIEDLDAKMNILQSRSPTDTWESVSDRVASEVGRVSATLNERVAEVERAMQTHSNSSPATTPDQNRIVQDDLQRLDSKVEVSLRAFSGGHEKALENMWNFGGG